MHDSIENDSLLCIRIATPYNIWNCVKFLTFSFFTCFDTHLCSFVFMLNIIAFVIASLFEAYSCCLEFLYFHIASYFNWRVYSVLVRVFIVSNSLFSYMCFLMESSWKQFVLCYFVRLWIKTGVGYELKLVICLLRVTISSSKVVRFNSYA